MAEVFKLLNKVKHYPWGSVSLIPQFLGREENTEPWAEIWMGAYPGFSSQAELAGGECGLDELIAKNPIHYLGEKAARKYGILPFLFKVLAPDKPMSIQAHPSMAQAKEGFARENAAALPLYAHNRNYKDANHKPEILCAIAHNGRNLPFIGLCGFRNPQEIHSLLSAFLKTDAAAPYYGNLQENFITLLQTLKIPNPSSALNAFFIALFNLSPQEREILTTNALSLNTLCAISKKNSSLLSSDGDEIQLIQNFAALYPGDPAVISPLYLNVFRLEQGEAIFLEAGILHAYCSGFGIELMANSDNILRGGLTNKYIDVPELINILDFNPYIPKIIKPDTHSACFKYPFQSDEFSLRVMHGVSSAGKAESTAYPCKGTSVCIVTHGEVSIGNIILRQGESAFIPPPASKDGPLLLKGNYTLYIASAPQPAV